MTPPHASPAPEQEPVAVIGVSALMPGSTDADGFWRTVVEGRDLITEVPRSHWLVSDYYDPDPAAPDKTYAYRGAFLDPVEFDPLAHGLPPTALPATDTAQPLTLIAAQQLMDDIARHGPARHDPDRVSVILGAGALELVTTMGNRMQRPVWAKALREAGLPPSEVDAICDRIAEHYVPWQEATLPGLLGNVIAGRVANRFDFHGTNFTTDAACAASLAAVSSAVNELRLRQADMVVTGGVDTLNDALWFTCFSKTPALSPTGDCRPFSADSDGMVLGEGIALFALKRLADAERDGDAVYAVIRGLGTSSDGRGTAVYTPLPQGQVRALRRAYQAAGYSPDTVELMEAHGTGTVAGDAAEVTALREVFGAAARSPLPWCALGSVKSQVGHTTGAAGAVGLLKAVLALHHQVLPPTIKVTRPNPRLAGSPFEVNTATRPWIRDTSHPRRASVSSFGFGGTNFHVAVEEYVPRNGGRRAYRTRTAPSELIVLSAASAEELLDKCRDAAEDRRPLSAIARESQEGLLPHPASGPRVAIVAADGDALAHKAAQVVARVRSAPDTPFHTPDGVHYGIGRPSVGRIAFLFPGQGSQYVGMGADVAVHVTQARQLWDRLAGVELADRPLHRVVFPAPAFDDEEREAQNTVLTATEWAQPAVAAHSMALLAVLEAVGLRADCVAGHSLGELTALHAAGVLDSAALLGLARRRGELMRDVAREPGGMLAVQAPLPRVGEAIREVGARDLWPANHNAPGQVVVSGGRKSLAALERRLAQLGVRAKPLKVSAAFHSPLVQDAAGPLREYLGRSALAAPAVPVYANSDAAVYPSAPEQIADRIARQLVSPVHFADQLRAMYDDGVRTFVEVGPGAVLTGLVQANLGDRPHAAIPLDQPGKNGLTALQHGLARLVVHGVPVDFASLWRDHPAQLPPAPRKSAATVWISGTNYGKPYPPAEPADPAPAPPTQASPEAARPERVPSTPEVLPVMPNPAHEPADRLELHRLAAEAHAAYQRATADAHVAYLAAVGRSLDPGGEAPSPPHPAPAGGAANGAPSNGTHRTAPFAAEPFVPATEPAPMDPPPPAAGFSADVPGNGFDSFHVPRSGTPAAEFPSTPEPAAPAGGTGASGAGPDRDLVGLTLEVIADKTGYPAEILKPEMHLQADLGIDSIKRVEVLSALRDRVDGLPTLDAAELGRLQTIGEIAARLTAEVN